MREPNNSRIIEIVGLLAVVISLVFVGYEIRENTKLASAQALLELSQLSQENLLLVVDNDSLNELLLRAEKDHSNLSQEEHRKVRQYIYAVWNTYEAAFQFREKGILSEIDFRPWLGAIYIDYVAELDKYFLNEGYIVLDEALINLANTECHDDA